MRNGKTEGWRTTGQERKGGMDMEIEARGRCSWCGKFVAGPGAVFKIAVLRDDPTLSPDDLRENVLPFCCEGHAERYQTSGEMAGKIVSWRDGGPQI